MLDGSLGLEEILILDEIPAGGNPDIGLDPNAGGNRNLGLDRNRLLAEPGSS